MKGTNEKRKKSGYMVCCKWLSEWRSCELTRVLNSWEISSVANFIDSFSDTSSITATPTPTNDDDDYDIFAESKHRLYHNYIHIT